MDLFTANKLTELRKKQGLSQEALAEKIGVSRQAISKWERGEASPGTDNLLQLARLYGVSLDDLLGDKKARELTADTPDTQGQTEESDAVPGDGKARKPSFFTKKSTQEKPARMYEKLGRLLLRLPVPLLAIVGFLTLGFGAGKWHPGWLVFLTVPIYYLLALACMTRSKKAFLLALPVHFTLAALFVTLVVLNGWQTVYLLLLSGIPLYIWIVLAR